MPELEQGKRFSLLYVTVDSPLKDSDKVRFRISKVIDLALPYVPATRRRYGINHPKAAQDLLEAEVGRQFRTIVAGQMYSDWRSYFQKITITEFLDSVTVLVGYLQERMPDQAAAFVRDVKRVFEEENLAYVVDDKGGIHPQVDAAFAVARQLSITALAGDRYVGTVELVEALDPCLLQDPPNYIGSIRAVFGANENIFKLMFNVPRLDAKTAADKISKMQQAMYEGHPTQQRASASALAGFKGWIDSAHHYRHEQGTEAPSQPNEELALMLIHQGLAFVRWLAQLDQRA